MEASGLVQLLVAGFEASAKIQTELCLELNGSLEELLSDGSGSAQSLLAHEFSDRLHRIRSLSQGLQQLVADQKLGKEFQETADVHTLHAVTTNAQVAPSPVMGNLSQVFTGFDCPPALGAIPWESMERRTRIQPKFQEQQQPQPPETEGDTMLEQNFVKLDDLDTCEEAEEHASANSDSTLESEDAHERCLLRWQRWAKMLYGIRNSSVSVIKHSWTDLAVNFTSVINLAMVARKESNAKHVKCLAERRSLETRVNSLWKRVSRVSRKSVGTTSVRTSVTYNSLTDDLTVWKKWCQYFMLFRCVRAIHPYSLKRASWDLVGLLCAAKDVITWPMSVFDLPPDFFEFERNFELFSTVFWFFDIFVSMLTGYLNDAGDVVDDRGLVMRKYLQTWFAFDTSLTINDLLSVVGLADRIVVLRSGKNVMRIIRVLRLFRLLKIVTVLRRRIGVVRSELIVIVCGLLRLLVLIIITSHYAACFWYSLARTARDQATSSWLDLNKNFNGDWVFAYSTSMHWALTQFTPASMEVYPCNVQERVFSLFVIVNAIVIFSYFVGRIQQGLQLLREIHNKRSFQQSQIRAYFSQSRISYSLSTRVWYFLQQRDMVISSRTYFDDVTAFQTLPRTIRNEILVEERETTYLLHPFFYMFAQLEPLAMQHICVTAMERIVLLATEDIFGGGSNVNRMLFVTHGVLKYEHGMEFWPEIKVLRGEWACEEALWGCTPYVHGPFVAGQAEGSELLAVKPDEFLDGVKTYAVSTQFAARYAKCYIDACNKATEIEDEDCLDNVLFNNFNHIVALVRDAACQAKVTVQFANEG